MSGSAAAQRDWVERVLGVAVPGPPGSAPTGATRAAAAAAEIAAGLGSLTIAFRKARLDWGQVRGDAIAAIVALQARLRATLAGEPDFAALDREIGKFDEIVATLDTELEATLDAAMNATDAARRLALKQTARNMAAGCAAKVRAHPFLPKIDGNQVLPVTVFATLTATLDAIARELA